MRPAASSTIIKLRMMRRAWRSSSLIFAAARSQARHTGRHLSAIGMAPQPLRALEFYSGIGGMHASLRAAVPDAEVVCAFEINDTANDVYEFNWAKRPKQVAATNGFVRVGGGCGGSGGYVAAVRTWWVATACCHPLRCSHRPTPPAHPYPPTTPHTHTHKDQP